ncbi:MAG: alkaline phosphatase family protein [Candidatus Zipacnadales bacterium]
MMNFHSARPTRVLVIGLDGATFDVIEPWVRAGHLPNIKRLMAEGTWGPLHSTIHPLTPTAWTTFLTGRNPGKHGIYDFALFLPGSYDPVLTNASHSRAPTIFQLLSEAGRRVVGYNIPWTYPPEPVNGVLIAGFGAPGFDRRIAYPAKAFDALVQRVDRMSFEIPPRNDRGVIVEAVEAQVAQVGEMARFLIRSERPDLACVVFMATDQVGHVAWVKRKAVRRDGRRIDDVLLYTYTLVDKEIGRLLDVVGDETTVILMSDHGFGRRNGVIDVGAALHERGLVAYEGSEPLASIKVRRMGRRGGWLGIAETVLKTVLPKGLRARMRASMTPTIDFKRTKVWVWGRYPKLRFNVKGREPWGVVEPGGAVERLREEVCECLFSIIDPAEVKPVIERIWRGEEIYEGAPPGEAPDLVAATRGFEYISRDTVTAGTRAFLTPEARQAVGWRHEQGGIHRMNGIFVACGPGVRVGGRVQGAALVDVAPTILQLLQVPIPRAMDGKVLLDVLTDAVIGEPVYTDRDPPPQPRYWGEQSSEDVAQVTERLRELGYVD